MPGPRRARPLQVDAKIVPSNSVTAKEHEAGGAQVGEALAVPQVAVAGDVLGEDGLAAGEHLVADELRDAGIVLERRISVAVDGDLQLGAALEKAADAYQQMITGKARFRVVLTMS